MPIPDRLGAIAAWAATAPVRRWFFERRGLSPIETTAEDGLRLRGWCSDVAGARGTVVIGHGYRDDRRQLSSLAPALSAVGLRVVLFDFRAHGRSEGSRITIGHDESKDVRAMLAWASTLGGPVSYVGFSMGAAAYLLSGVEAHAAVLDSPYDTLSEAIRVRASRFRVPAPIEAAFRRAKADRCALVIDEVRPIDVVPRLARPTLLVFARGDAWIPEATRARFHAALSPACAYEEVEGGHHDHFDRGWIERVTRFLSRV